jgi:hypothetical protein
MDQIFNGEKVPVRAFCSVATTISIKIGASSTREPSNEFIVKRGVP